ncbi:helix-turn-helix transcriptional regulator [Lachnospiraceae bacterium 48-21]
MDTEFQVIAKNIKFLREKMGYTQEQLAEATELSVSHLSKVESGQRRIGMRAYISILRVLGATEEEYISTMAEGETGDDFKQYQNIMEDCNEAEKKFLLDTLENLKVNMKEFLCGNYPTGV